MKILSLLATLILLPFIAFTTIRPGAIESEGLVFTPVTPCRIVDTRLSDIVPFVPGTGFVAFLVKGDGDRTGLKDRGLGVPVPFSFSDQGGEPDGCGIPMNASAVAMTMTVLPLRHAPFETTAGYAIAYVHAVAYYTYSQIPIFAERPKAVTVTWGASDAQSTSHAIVETCVEATAPFGDCNEDFLVWSLRPTRLVVDIHGYFAEERE